jgi:hypothetical protein
MEEPLPQVVNSGFIKDDREALLQSADASAECTASAADSTAVKKGQQY